MTTVTATWKGLKGAQSGTRLLVDEAAIEYQAAVKTVSNAVRKNIRAAAPTDRKSPRRLPKAIRVKVSGRKWDTVGKVTGGRLAHLVEFDTKAHEIVPRKARALKFGERFAARVRHPGTKGQPFFWPTVDRMRDDIDAVNRELGTKIIASVQRHIELDK